MSEAVDYDLSPQEQELGEYAYDPAVIAVREMLEIRGDLNTPVIRTMLIAMQKEAIDAAHKLVVVHPENAMMINNLQQIIKRHIETIKFIRIAIAEGESAEDRIRLEDSLDQNIEPLPVD